VNEKTKTFWVKFVKVTIHQNCWKTPLAPVASGYWTKPSEKRL